MKKILRKLLGIKVIFLIYLPFGFIYIYLHRILTGKPDKLIYITDLIEKVLKCKVLEIEIGKFIGDKNIYFHTDIPSGSETKIIKLISTNMNLPILEISTDTSKDKKMVVILTGKALDSIQYKINHFPNLWEKIVSWKPVKI